MLYLMLDKTTNDYFAKVGFSNGLRSRRAQYKSYNPTAIMRSSCAGREAQERHCHSILFSQGQRIQGTEWAKIPKNLFNELYTKGMGYFYSTGRPIHFLED